MKTPSEEEMRIADARLSGRRLRDVADEYGTGPERVRQITWKVERYRRAAEILKRDPHDLEAWAGVGRLSRSMVFQLAEMGARKLTDLRALTLWHLEVLPGVGPKGRAALLELMAEYGVSLAPDERRKRRRL